MTVFWKDVHVVNGVVRWVSDDSVPFDDVLGELLDEGLIDTSTLKTTVEAREKEEDAWLEEYRNNPPQLSEGDLNELRTIHGSQAKVIDIFSGKEIIL
jgi:hypothetical protein